MGELREHRTRFPDGYDSRVRRNAMPIFLRLLIAVLVFLALAWVVGLVLKVVRWLIILAMAVVLGLFIAREARQSR